MRARRRRRRWVPCVGPNCLASEAPCPLSSCSGRKPAPIDRVQPPSTVGATRTCGWRTSLSTGRRRAVIRAINSRVARCSGCRPGRNPGDLAVPVRERRLLAHRGCSRALSTLPRPVYGCGSVGCGSDSGAREQRRRAGRRHPPAVLLPGGTRVRAPARPTSSAPRPRPPQTESPG